MMRKIISLALLLVTAVSAPAQTDVSIYTPGVTAEGVVYFLPKTILKITVTSTEQTYSPGEFAHYAERYLKMNGISEEERHSWQIADVKVEPYGVPDTREAYSIRFSEKSIAPLVCLTRDGIISTINVPEAIEREENQTTTAVEKSDPHEFLTEDILMATSKAKMAELTAKEIFSIRESRNDITRGQAEYIPTDGVSLKYLLENLDRQEKSLLRLFTGTTETGTHTSVFYVSPEESQKDVVVFRISSKLGILNSDNLAGAPVYLSIKNLRSLPVPVADKKKKATNSIRYCVPGRAHVKVYDSRATYCDDEVSIAQFGNIEVLSTTLLTKSANTKIVFDTATGNITSISE
ncbi:MAG: DUF4831 family protein [Bacteroidaceae bacterium]|nr:DUF4831 family protein [Bacteroidaceae bacterium]